MKLLYAIEYVVSYCLYCTGLYWVRKKLLERRGARVVLVYHRIMDGTRGLGEAVGEAAFDEQMRYLRTHCTPTMWETIQSSAETPRGIHTLVTFDDGYRDNFTRAQPVLERNGIPAVFFLTTSLVFDHRPLSDADDDGSEDDFPTEEHLIAAARSPLIAIGNHTSTHEIVSTLDAGGLDRELASSQTLLRERLNCAPEVFAYPRGRSGDLGVNSAPVLERHGIRAAFTMVPGLIEPDTPRYELPRIGMSHVNDQVVFKVKMVGMLDPLVRLKNRLGY